MSKEKLIALLTILLIGVTALASYFFFANGNLKADILKSQNLSEERISDLEKKINQITSSPPLTGTPSTEEGKEDAKKSETSTPQFMSEEELLKNYFAQPPTLIMPGAEEGQQKNEADPSGPILTITPEIYDLGTISKAKGSVTANFELKNTGKADLT